VRIYGHEETGRLIFKFSEHARKLKWESHNEMNVLTVYTRVMKSGKITERRNNSN
jgi:hypothetical protein